MPDSKDPIVYRYSGANGESLTGIPARSLRQSDVDALDADQKRLLKAHLEADHLPHKVYRSVDADAPKAAPKAADEAKAPAKEAPAPAKDAKAADQQKKGDG